MEKFPADFPIFIHPCWLIWGCPWVKCGGRPLLEGNTTPSNKQGLMNMGSRLCGVATLMSARFLHGFSGENQKETTRVGCVKVGEPTKRPRFPREMSGAPSPSSIAPWAVWRKPVQSSNNCSLTLASSTPKQDGTLEKPGQDGVGTGGEKYGQLG